MLKALKKIAPDWYTPNSQKKKKNQKKEDNPARFKIRPLTPPERESLMESDGVFYVIRPVRYADVLRMAVSDWENFIDEDGKPVEHKATEHWRIPGPDRIDVALEILNRSRLLDEEAKN